MRGRRIRCTLAASAGLTLAVLTGFAGFFAGQFLDASKLDLDLGPLGEVHVTGAFPFDVGVYLVVVGLSITGLLAFGEDGEVS